MSVHGGIGGGMSSLAVRWNGLAAAALIALGAGPAAAQNKPPAVPPPVPLSAPQRAALVLGRWETCIDVSVKFLTNKLRRPERAAAAAEARCDEFRTQLRPIMAETLGEMMYGSSEQQVTEQTDAAMASLRRHIHTRALAAAKKARGW
jgi:hypothetical protein